MQRTANIRRQRAAWLTVFVLLLSVSVLQGQTPKTLSVTNANVTKTWTVTGYEVVISDPANPLNGSIGIRFALVTKVGGDVIATEQRSATASGPAVVAALIADADARVRKLVAANDPDAYFKGTRAALYAWLQAHGHIDKAAQ